MRNLAEWLAAACHDYHLTHLRRSLQEIDLWNW